MKFEIPKDLNNIQLSTRFRWWRERMYGRILKLFKYKSKYFVRKEDIDD